MSRRAALLILILLALGLAGCNGLFPAVTPQPANVLFADQFRPGQTGRWRLEGDDVSWAALIGEQLVIEVGAPETVHFATLDGEQFSDFVLEVEATLLDGDPQSSYGVLFRMAAPDQFYRFEVTGSGLFAVERQDGGGNWTRLTAGWLDSTALEQGAGAMNHLRVAASGAQLTFAVNGEEVAAFQDATYAQGSIALDAGTFDGGVRVAFDNLVIYRP